MVRKTLSKTSILALRVTFLIHFFLLCFIHISAQERWSEQKATAWHDSEGWLIGSNYIPATAINQLEMWQAETFNPARIDLEFGWAEDLGMNTMRVFLHDLAYSQDPEGFKARLNKFLEIAAKHKIKPMFVLFDSVWDPNPQIGLQRAPRAGVHNSGWLQSPGATALKNPAEYARLEKYVTDVLGTFSKDKRILAWDLWNEPDNTNGGSYDKYEPENKIELINQLLPKVFSWARAAVPEQPLTSGVWKGDFSSDDKLDSTQQIQIQLSDFITFHSYGSAEEFEKRVSWLQVYNRPVMCTEYMARPFGSTFMNILPIGKKFNIGMINWGFVQGKTQTIYPWDSWAKPYDQVESLIWFHDIYRTDGTPYSSEETEFIKRFTGKLVSKPVTSAQ